MFLQYSLCFFLLSFGNDSLLFAGNLNKEIIALADSGVVCTESHTLKAAMKSINSHIQRLSEKQLQDVVSYCIEMGYGDKAFFIRLCKSNILYKEKQYRNALAVLPRYDKGIAINDVLIARYYENKGDIERYSKDYANSSNSFLIAIKYYLLLEDNYQLTRMYYKLGALNLDIKNYILAEEYLLLAVEYAKKSTDERLLKATTSTLASCYHSQSNFDSALKLYLKVLDEYSLTKMDSARILMNIGSIYRAKDFYNEAQVNFLKSLTIREELRDEKAIAQINNNLGGLYLEQGLLEKAYYHIWLCYKFAKKHKESSFELKSAYNLIEYYVQSSQRDSALKYLRDYVELREELSLSELKNELIELDRKYKILEKDNQIAQLQKEDALNQARLKTKNILIAVTGSFLLILILVGYLINRQRKELAQSRRRLLRQKEDISGMNDQLRVSNLAKDRILSVIGHDLRGPVGGLKELIELYMELPEYEPNDIKNLLKTARESSTSTYHLLENLLSWANSQRGDIVFNPVATPLAPLIKQSVQLLDRSINVRNVRFEYDIPQALVIQVDMNMLRTIIRNLVSNALKYSPDNGLIKIMVLKEANQVKFCICDQGKGMTADETQNIFKKKETYFIGSELTAKGTGLGLILCKEFVERHGGSIWINSEEGVGTQVWFSILQKGVSTTKVNELQSSAAQ